MKGIHPQIVSKEIHLVISSKRRQALLEKNKPTRIEIERNEERARKELDKERNQVRVEQQYAEMASKMAPREERNIRYSNLIVDGPENSVTVRRERSLWVSRGRRWFLSRVR